jgi:hypothetical protein
MNKYLHEVHTKQTQPVQTVDTSRMQAVGSKANEEKRTRALLPSSQNPMKTSRSYVSNTRTDRQENRSRPMSASSYSQHSTTSDRNPSTNVTSNKKGWHVKRPTINGSVFVDDKPNHTDEAGPTRILAHSRSTRRQRRQLRQRRRYDKQVELEHSSDSKRSVRHRHRSQSRKPTTSSRSSPDKQTHLPSIRRAQHGLPSSSYYRARSINGYLPYNPHLQLGYPYSLAYPMYPGMVNPRYDYGYDSSVDYRPRRTKSTYRKKATVSWTDHENTDDATDYETDRDKDHRKQSRMSRRKSSRRASPTEDEQVQGVQLPATVSDQRVKHASENMPSARQERTKPGEVDLCSLIR